jgi:hypothetical protein
MRVGFGVDEREGLRRLSVRQMVAQEVERETEVGDDRSPTVLAVAELEPVCGRDAIQPLRCCPVDPEGLHASLTEVSDQRRLPTASDIEDRFGQPLVGKT